MLQPLARRDDRICSSGHALPPLHLRLRAGAAVGVEPRPAGPVAVRLEQKQRRFAEGWLRLSPQLNHSDAFL